MFSNDLEVRSSYGFQMTVFLFLHKSFLPRLLLGLALLVPNLASAQSFLLPKSVSSSAAQERAPIKNFPTESSDLRIEKILNNLRTQSNWFPEVKVHVTDGIVVLEGRTSRKEHLDWLIKSVERIPEVLTVVNRVEVTTPDLSTLHPFNEDLKKFVDKLERALPLFAIVVLSLIAFFLLGKYLNRGVRTLWKKRIPNPFLLVLVSRLTVLPIWIFFFYILLQTLGLSALGATVVGGTGILGIVIGLAFKGIAENYLAGLLLATRSPFTKGDLIKINEYHGYVQNLNMRGTTIIDLDGNLILIPNIMVIQSVVENQSANPNTRTSFELGISYQDSITKVQELIIEAMLQVKGVLKNPAPNVIIQSLTPASVRIKVQVWFNVKESNEQRVRSRAMIQTKETLLANGITIPDEAREVLFGDSLKIQMIESPEALHREVAKKKHQIQQHAASNLEESKMAPTGHDAAGRDLMHLAEQNPLPVNTSRPDLLKKDSNQEGKT